MKKACIVVNHFLREHFPNQTWTSIAVLYNPSMPLHRDILNMIGHANHAITLGNFMEGRVWIEDENGQATALLVKTVVFVESLSSFFYCILRWKKADKRILT